MSFYRADHRKSNVLILLGTIFMLVFFWTQELEFPSPRRVGVIFIFSGLSCIIAALLYRYKVQLEEETLTVSSRFNWRKIVIPLSEIRTVKVKERDYISYNLVHLLLWDKKFKKLRDIELYDIFGKIIFSIDGQSIDTRDISKLLRDLK